MENVAEITQAETEEKEGAKYITVPEDELLPGYVKLLPEPRGKRGKKLGFLWWH